MTAQTAPDRQEVVARLMAGFARAKALTVAGDLVAARDILDRLVTAAPQTPPFRLWLAEVLWRLGETDRARFHFDALRAAALSPPDRAHVAARLAQLAADPGWQVQLTFGLVPQSNVGQRTDTDTITVDGLDFGLDAASQAGAGTGLSVATGAARQWVVAPGTALAFSVQGNGFFYSESRFNDVQLRAALSLRRQLRADLIGEIGLALNHRFLGDSPYSRGPGVWLGAEAALGPATVLTARAQLDDLTHFDAAGLDGARRGLRLGLRHQVDPALVVTARLGFDRTDAVQPSEAGRRATLGLGVQKTFPRGLTVGLDLSGAHETRDAPDALLGVLRRDVTTALSLRLMQRDFTLFNHVPTIELRHERRRSTLSLAEFTNTSFGIFLSREF